jgi:protocatechuate 3,4-dioxygenase beta subunit
VPRPPITPVQRARRRILVAASLLGVPPLLGRLPAVAATSNTAIDAACVLSPAMTEGPYFIDERLNRSDLAAGSNRAGVLQGLPLLLRIDLRNVAVVNCPPVAGMQVDIWHCDAAGEYSDVFAGTAQSAAKGQSFLRGYQVSGADGRVAFRTIYPGWYPGRTIHIHVKARAFDGAGNRAFEFTTQLFFDDAVNDVVMAAAPYNTRGTRRIRNANESIYADQTAALVRIARAADGARGYVANATLGLLR